MGYVFTNVAISEAGGMLRLSSVLLSDSFQIRKKGLATSQFISTYSTRMTGGKVIVISWKPF
jgi:hypothetical protein